MFVTVACGVVLLVLVLVGLLLVGLLLIYFKYTHHLAETTYWELAIPNLRPRNLTILHASDFHYDPSSAERERGALIALVAAAKRVRPDLICLTGDFVIRDAEPIEGLCEYLRQLKGTARLGVFASLGNHESYGGHNSRDLITQHLQAAGVRVLRNERVTFEAENVCLVGLEDMWCADWCNAIPTLKSLTPSVNGPDDQVVVVMSHNPDSAEALQDIPYNLQLAGHTHGGQICFPKWFPVPGLPSQYPVPVLAVVRRLLDCVTPFFPQLHRKLGACHKWAYVVRHWEWASGLHRLSQNHNGSAKWLFVTRGIASMLNLRVFCPPEVAVLQLVRRDL